MNLDRGEGARRTRPESAFGPILPTSALQRVGSLSGVHGHHPANREGACDSNRPSSRKVRFEQPPLESPKVGLVRSRTPVMAKKAPSVA
jgi:hypothetical protein